MLSAFVVKCYIALSVSLDDSSPRNIPAITSSQVIHSDWWRGKAQISIFTSTVQEEKNYVWFEDGKLPSFCRYDGRNCRCKHSWLLFHTHLFFTAGGQQPPAETGTVRRSSEPQEICSDETRHWRWRERSFAGVTKTCRISGESKLNITHNERLRHSVKILCGYCVHTKSPG